MLSLYLKSLHIIFIVTWFAGLFYIVRLFIYHVEATQKQEPDRSILISHFKLAEKRLWYGITYPSMLLTWITGLWMALEIFGWDFPAWLWLKLGLVAGLTIYHFICQGMFTNLRHDKIKYTSFGLRVWNEVTTLFLFAIVFIVVLKGSGNWWAGITGLVILALILYAAIFIYKKIRNATQK